ncbi:hypothetical protein V8C42DRAFT_308475 [Trichoderma barbatum]
MIPPSFVHRGQRGWSIGSTDCSLSLAKAAMPTYGRIGHSAWLVSTSIMHGRSRLQHNSRRVNRSQPMPMDPDPEAEILPGIRAFLAIHTPLCEVGRWASLPGWPEGRVSE